MNNSIFPCLWFDGQAKAAAEFYCSIFKDSKITADTPMVVTFELNGNKFMGLNGGPNFKFNEAVSFVVNCDTQDEIDHYWTKLTEGGQESMCGWLKDKFGGFLANCTNNSWQTYERFGKSTKSYASVYEDEKVQYRSITKCLKIQSKKTTNR